jgi:hypothetical protein
VSAVTISLSLMLASGSIFQPNRMKARPMSCEAIRMSRPDSTRNASQTRFRTGGDLILLGRRPGQCRAVYGQMQVYLTPGIAYEPSVG